MCSSICAHFCLCNILLGYFVNSNFEICNLPMFRTGSLPWSNAKSDTEVYDIKKSQSCEDLCSDINSAPIATAVQKVTYFTLSGCFSVRKIWFLLSSNSRAIPDLSLHAHKGNRSVSKLYIVTLWYCESGNIAAASSSCYNLIQSNQLIRILLLLISHQCL